MPLIQQNSRISHHRFTTTDAVPTIPSISVDHTDGTWVATDLHLGEIGMNMTDDRFWWRSNNGIVEMIPGGIAKVTLTAQELATLNSSPIEAIAAPGTGYAISVISATINFTYNTVAFANSDPIQLFTDTAAAAQFESSITMDTAASSFTNFLPVLVFTPGSETNVVEDKALNITCASDSVASPNGDGTAVVYITYRVIRL